MAPPQLSVVLGALLMLTLVWGNNIPVLDYQCIPCVSFGGYYCYDDPWRVNFKGDKCYEHAVDVRHCETYNFTNNVENCT
mmetsp:Transcript_15310/g.23574  ORF Transcript_15310/g.23574 Transcript_15310/m.23574 type:complete len:80 (-) Transcript_15310:390-629(-)|eukprot:CAMPEP_0170486046 /NCGR_PEP_ID=MMETSP0208-20121228/5168_1 /TAXON_ID=197538 /ORGANISM="Strombidium inclinatum, Strain S3" /LENGTH=79 /DNA_ID=CAMNT_0010759879 /DNA_START=12 /DNA_END=254 /DNA_ORIENTATION=-